MAIKRYIRPQGVCAALLSITLISSITFFYFHGSFTWLDHFFYDLHIKARGAAPGSKDIVLVLMDDKSSVELKRTRGAWSRMHLALALQKEDVDIFYEYASSYPYANLIGLRRSGRFGGRRRRLRQAQSEQAARRNRAHHRPGGVDGAANPGPG